MLEFNKTQELFSKKQITLLVFFLLILIADQSLKVWVKLNFHLGEHHSILGLNWAYLKFVENEGAAFGFLLGGETGKVVLTFIRLIATVFIAWVLYGFIKDKKDYRIQFFLTLVLAGAVGNLVDSMFYGILFSASPFHGGIAEWLPEDGGYAPLFMGRVVDMFYFPLIEIQFPDWIPFFGEKSLKIIQPVFNLADMAITLGIVGLIVLFRKW
ncbi:MAG: lipoprotein signal peptidase [Saprospirales bacterium]|nr:MAG: lipoprotein signal peptidase [Saprospirales bacterium]